MEGLTAREIAEKLNLPYKTVRRRIERAGIKPLSYEALYDPSVLDTVRNTPSPGRPRKKLPKAP